MRSQGQRSHALGLRQVCVVRANHLRLSHGSMLFLRKGVAICETPQQSLDNIHKANIFSGSKCGDLRPQNLDHLDASSDRLTTKP